MNAPARTNGISVAEIVTAPTTPIATAPASDTPASATSVPLDRRVPSGLPFSSSRTCAHTPTPSRNAPSVAASRSPYRCGATAAPIATLARFQAV